MEGTYTTLTDLFLFEAGASEAATRGDNREVLNNVRALEGDRPLEHLPISTRLIRDTHRVLLLNAWRLAVDQKEDDMWNASLPRP